MGNISNRGFASMDPELRSFYASQGGKKSTGNFAFNPLRASAAGKIGAAHQSIEDKRRGGRNSNRRQLD